MIRSGRHEDLPAIVAMSVEFWRHTAYDDPCNPDTVAAMAQACIDSEMMSVLEVDGEAVGFACGVVGPLLGNADVLTGTELAWWVSPDHRHGRNGIALLRHLERQAKAQGVKYWNMVYMQSSMPKEIQGIYERLGYERTEVSYSKVL